MLIHHCRRPAVLLLALAALALPAPLPAALDVEGLYAVTVPLAEGERRPGAGTARRALEKVLVRVTGQRDVALDPAAAAVLDEAERLVQQQGLASRREVRYVFDGDAVRRLATGAGLPWWERVRPVTLLLLIDDRPAPASAAGADARAGAVPGDEGASRAVGPGAAGTARQVSDMPADPFGTAAGPELPRLAPGQRYLSAGTGSELLARVRAVAEDRGVPLVLPAMDALDEALLLRETVSGAAPRAGAGFRGSGTGAFAEEGAGAPAGAETRVGEEAGAGDHAGAATAPGVGDRRDGPLTSIATRYGADLVLLGEVSRDIPDFVLLDWQVLLDEQAGLRWTGPPGDGVEFVADLLAQRYAARLEEQAHRIPVRVDAVADVLDYARTLAHLGRFELVDRVSLDRVEGRTLFLSLETRVEPLRLARLIALADFLRPAGESFAAQEADAPLHYRFGGEGAALLPPGELPEIPVPPPAAPGAPGARPGGVAGGSGSGAGPAADGAG